MSDARDALDPEVRRDGAARILGHLRAWSVWQGAAGVAAFWAIRSEVSLEPLLRSFVAGEGRLFLPRTVSKTELAFIEVSGATGLDELEQGRFGVLEPPADGHRVELSTADGVDLVLVPGLAFGRDGSRLGYGAGYYDRALTSGARRGKPITCGVCFDLQFDPADAVVPVGDDDVPVDFVVTPSGLVAASK